MSRRLLCTSALLVLAIAAHARGEGTFFPFVISYDSPRNVTNVAAWLDHPAGQHGFVRADSGHLATDAGPARFWATNFCFKACFPEHDVARRVAARLARLGINCVRLHHMDSEQIWGRSPNHLTIDPEQLERLDYLIAQFQQHGVYVDINLHVSRWLGPKEGFPAREGRPHYDKGLDNFEPREIELQKKYARDLLTHVNPYTHRAYTDEPAVAFVEINNENALFANWNSGDLDDLPEPYATTFRQVWNAWLRAKYGTTEKLQKAWGAGEVPLGAELLHDAPFAQPPGKTWILEQDDLSKLQWSVHDDGPDGQRYLRLAVTKAGRVAWHPQLVQAGFAVRAGLPYTLTCWLRSDAPRRLHLNCMMAHDPYQMLGLAATVPAGPKWKQQRLTFVAGRDDAQARVSLSGLEPGTYELAGVSLRSGGVLGLEPGRRLEDQGVPVMRRSASLTQTARNDFVDFLWDTERDYWDGMRRFLKDELHVRSLVTGTQLNYSPLHVQAAMDYIDAHAYWQHPHFPHRAWDMKDWTVRNVALVNSPGGTLAGLAVRRVAGMPFTVSEYNHPAPLEYSGEGFPMIAAFGAFQGWDAIFSFAYCHNDKFEPRQIDSFFDIKADTAKIAHMPACAAMFLRGDVAPAREIIAVPVDRQAERRKLYETMSAWTINAENFGLDPRESLLHAVAMDPRKGKTAAAPATLPTIAEAARVFRSDTGQLCWELPQSGHGCFTVDTPRSKLFTGFVAGRCFTLGDVGLEIGPTERDWATVSLVCIDGKGFDQPGRILIAATGMVHNQGAELEHLHGDLVTLGNRWGTAPILCEGVKANILLPAPAGRVTLYGLDESGNRRTAIPTQAHQGRALLPLDAKHATVWYEAEIK